MNDARKHGEPKANPDNGRDVISGQFTKGNPGGPGNPFNREIAVLRREMIAAVSAGDVQDIIRQVVIKARLGDLTAAKIALSYVIGKPTPAVDPDRVDLDEWDINRQRPETAAVSDVIKSGCLPVLANGMVRGMDIATLTQSQQLIEAAEAKDRQAKERRDRAKDKRNKRGPRATASELSILGNGHGKAPGTPDQAGILHNIIEKLTPIDGGPLRDMLARKSRPTGNGHNGDGGDGMTG